MHIAKLRVVNFKKYEDTTFTFNSDINIVVGDNDSGKSTLFEAIEVCLNSSYRGKPLYSELSSNLFNYNAIKKFTSGDMEYDKLPEIIIEAYLVGLPEYKGDNNTFEEDSDGISIRIKFDEDLIEPYTEFVSTQNELTTIPVEFYTIEWYSFSWKPIKYINKKINCLVVDPQRFNPASGRNKYISRIIKTTLSREQQTLLNINYRTLKESFNDKEQVIEINKDLDPEKSVTDKELQIIADVSSNAVENGLQLAVNEIDFSQIGKGEQSTIQIKLAIQNKADNVDILLVEEPENHLSHMNLSKLIKYIEDKRGSKQLFITTHSSFVLNKLNMNHLCLLGKNYTQVNKIDPKITKHIQRFPGYDTLRIILAKKVILVEGPSDELILKKIYLFQKGRLPEENGIDIIVVRGIGFKNYLEIAKEIGNSIHVVKDNDSSYKKNIEDYIKAYSCYPNISIYSSVNDDSYSLEPALIYENSNDEKQLDKLVKIILSSKSFNKYNALSSKSTKINFLLEFYSNENGGGKKKVDSAIRLFDSDLSELKIPSYLIEALCFD